MRAWLAAHRYALRRALARLAARPFATALEVLVIALAMALPLAFALVVENVQAFAARHPAIPEISVFLALDAKPADIERIGRQLQAEQRVEAVRFVSRTEAHERLRRSSALADVLAALPENPLPDAYVLRVRAGDAGGLDALVRELSGWPQVAKVQLDSEWAHRLDALVRIGRLAAAGLGLVLAIAMLAVTFNTVRLQLLQQRDEIELVRLIGATDAFVRRPYLYFGILQGLLGAALALALVAAASIAAAAELARISAVYGTAWALEPVPEPAAAGVLLIGASLGGAAAWLSSTRTLRAR
jgi:cell division transport system permease protein